MGAITTYILRMKVQAAEQVMIEQVTISSRMLDWYDAHARKLPWRAPSGTLADPYRVWLSEIMLQQTTVAAVKPYFLRFLSQWPTLQDLAAAPQDDVLAAWAGLGYYSRARNLHACAQALAARGGFPGTAAELLKLPGIGPYTAAAIAAIAFGESATVVDGNVERVVARLFAVEVPLPLAKPELKRLAATLTPELRAGDYAQAMMDLGATVCMPRNPSCIICPVRSDCSAFARGIQTELPRRMPKPQRPQRQGLAYWLVRPDGAVLLRRRAPKGLLGGMVEVPSDVLGDVPLDTNWQETGKSIRHVFTHFELGLEIMAARVDDRTAATFTAPYLWATVDEMETLALPSVMRKIVKQMREG